MNIRYIIYSLLLLLATLLPTSCTHDDIVTGVESDMGKVHLSFGVSIPGASSSESRGFGDSFTGEIPNLWVASFVNVDGVNYFEELVQAIYDNETNKYEITLTKANSERRLHIIGNYPDLTMGVNTEGNIMANLVTANQNQDVYWNYCNLVENEGHLVLDREVVPLIRNYAKVQLDITDVDLPDNFSITRYALCYVPTKGRVAAYNPLSQDGFANFVSESGTCNTYNYMLVNQRYEGSEPLDDGTFLTATETINWHEPNIPFYIYERKNSGAKNPTCMLIEGTYSDDDTDESNNTKTYYKLDFVYDDNNTGTKVYFNLLRNFIYTMKLNSITGNGYDTPDKALDQPAFNNISASSETKEYTNISNGTGRLFVSTTYMLFTSQQTAYLYYKFIPDINNPTETNNDLTSQDGAVTITAEKGDNLVLGDYEVLPDVVGGVYDGWREIKLITNAVDRTGSKGQVITIAAGGLQRDVELVLRTPYEMNVTTTNQVLNVIKAPLDVNITLPEGLPESLFPLRLFINSDHNTIFPEYGTDMPAESQNNKYGFIKEVGLNEYQANKTFTCKFLTNCAGSATTVRVSNSYIVQDSNHDDNTFTNISNGMVLGSSIPVNIQKINGRYPQNIYNNGLNNGIEREVKVYVKNGDAKGDEIGTISVNRSNVTSSLALIYGDELSPTTDLIFEFTDKYWAGGDSWTTITYKATATLSNISNGLTFNPVSTYTEISYVTIKQGISVTVPTVTINNYWGNTTYYPQKLNNDGGEELVTITCNEIEVGQLTIKRNNSSVTVTENVNLYGLDGDSDLVFTFEDNYASSGGFNVSWNAATYTATCKVNAISGTGFSLEFRQQNN